MCKEAPWKRFQRGDPFYLFFHGTNHMFLSNDTQKKFCQHSSIENTLIVLKKKFNDKQTSPVFFERVPPNRKIGFLPLSKTHWIQVNCKYKKKHNANKTFYLLKQLNLHGWWFSNFSCWKQRFFSFLKPQHGKH